MPEIMAAYKWRNNADLINAARVLGYLEWDSLVLDPTYGHGVFWQKWQPKNLYRHDIRPDKAPDGVQDVRNLKYPNEQFDAVVFDPPYKMNGTPSPDDERYGVDIPVRWQDRLGLMLDGARECLRVTREGGNLLIKCQDQVVSGKKVWQTIQLHNYLTPLGARLVDQLHIITDPRPQPSKNQIHSRSNYSTLMIFRREH